ncbi:MAG: peptidyl-prolyl cis-trans isomerase [Bacteroidetes bacterium]|nr:MAG: peptidyl-prolyl cis-trans isomerase [Bacteroidota bacterium]
MNISRILLFTLALAWATTAFAQTPAKSAEAKSPVLLKFTKGSVTRSEFERVYAKNNGGPEIAATHTEAQFREYLNLYINFKRKVFEAEAGGLDTTAAFRNEFGAYRKQLAQPYLSAKEVEDKLIQEAYDRSKFLVSADHLLVNLAEDATPEDTLRAYQQAIAYRDSVVKGGKDFGYMAERYSGDPSAKSNKGNLGYFSVFDMVYPFEQAAYTTTPGSISMPIRTRFGYHLVKVNDKIPTEGKKKVAHIIVRVGDRYSARTEEQAEQIIKDIYARLKAGADFAAAAAQYSDDPGTAEKGGDLGTGRLLPEMETIKLRLGDGQISEPFKTQFGWHIMKVTEMEKLPSFEEARSGLKQRIARDTRAQLSRSALISRIKQENAYRLDNEVFTSFQNSLNADFSKGTWKPDSAQAALYQRPLFFLGSNYSEPLQNLVNYYQSNRPRKPKLTAAQASEELYQAYLEQQLLKYEEERLPEKNPEFRYLVQEYRDGILLFTLMEQKVWKKAVEDTAGLRQFYQDNLKEFLADESVDVREYRSADPAAIQQAAAWLAEGKTEKQIDSLVNRGGYKLRISTQTFEKGEKGIPEAIFAQANGYRSEVLSENGFYRILVTENKYPAGVKPFEKAKSECITRYQDYLEQQWLGELARKYPVKINEKVFKKLFK